MKKAIVQLLNTFIILSLVLFSHGCKKSNSSSSSFTWTYNGTANSAILYKAYISSMATTPIIVATKGTSLRTFNVSITVSSFNIGTYTINGGANSLLYIDFAGNTLFASAGSINITAYSNNSISGNFSATINDISGMSHPITGQFVNTPVEP